MDNTTEKGEQSEKPIAERTVVEDEQDKRHEQRQLEDSREDDAWGVALV